MNTEDRYLLLRAMMVCVTANPQLARDISDRLRADEDLDEAFEYELSARMDNLTSEQNKRMS